MEMVYHVNDDGKMMSQNVGLNYRENSIMVKAPAVYGKTPATMMHEFSEVKINILSFVVVISNNEYSIIWYDKKTN